MKLNSWFEIDDVDYCQYVLQGYEITADEYWVRWYLNGKLHRTDGPAVIHADGCHAWWLNDNQHRVDSPAVIYADGGQDWFLNDKYHRTDGPARIFADGTQEWWLNDNFFTEEEWRQQVEAEQLV